MNSIPELSFKDIEKGDLKSIALLSSALEDHGFFSITDHGLSKELLDKCYSSSIDFFNLDSDLKDAYNSKLSKGARGYTPFGKETALGETTPDMKEFWHHGPAIDDSFDSRIVPNIDVVEIPEFNSQFDELFDDLNILGMKVLSAIAVILHKEPNFFDAWVTKGNSLLRLLHYPPVSDPSNIYRARAHADINLITLLVGAEESGLEVKNSDGNWVPIEAKSKSIVCNIGDMMQLVTRQKLKSTPHRVVDHNASGSSRSSMPFFRHPAPTIMLK